MRILVIEDEVRIAELIKKRLEIDKFVIDLAYDGKEGLDKAKSGRYDLIVLDLMLPKIGGIKICKNLRKEKNQTPIIMLTAKDSLENKKKGFEAGADDYIIKPFSLEDLTARIKAILAKNNLGISTQAVLRSTKINLKRNEKEEECKIYKKILDNAPISIVTINKEGYMTSANKYFSNLTKVKDYRKNNVFKGDFFIRENLVGAYKKLLNDGTPFKKENCHEKNTKGQDKFLKITAVPIKDEKGTIEGAISMAVDNTEAVVYKNRLEDLNKKLEKRIKQRTVQLDKLNEQLNRVLEIKSTFMADISHEMRTSLSIIQCNLELISAQAFLKNEKSEEFGQIYDEIKRISNMLADMSLLSKSENSKQNLFFKTLDLDKKINSVCKSLKVLANEKNIDLRYEHAGEMEIVADESMIEKMLFNLIKNAIKYNREKGWVKIKLDKTKKHIVLKVSDGGIGINKKHLPYIFERFYRADKSGSRKQGGSGLGLAICKWVANVHGGEIEAKSTYGKGSIFTVKLPNDISSKQY